jgi:hypothetical protein
VRSLEEPDFLQTADRALFSIRRNDSVWEPRLVDANASLAHHVTALDLVVSENWRPPRRNATPKHAKCCYRSARR